ncbi:unnamed protein product [Arabis nemorensis]|uniref:Uncharacterized protein n=1 Tax=Arabis nemorensis TaxID=586526 RepID=A0A565ATU7_9BRAS|nr:unnamed protein product [Arabis nemorensis]
MHDVLIVDEEITMEDHSRSFKTHGDLLGKLADMLTFYRQIVRERSLSQFAAIFCPNKRSYPRP